MFHHNLQEFHKYFWAWTKENLAFSTLLSIYDGLQGVVKYTDSYHDDDFLLF